VLKQKYKNIEIIILDDSKNPETNQRISSLCKAFKQFSYLDVGNAQGRGQGNLSWILNKGIQFARGEFIARLDSDDVSMASRISFQVRMMKRKQLDLLGSRAINIDNTGRYIHSTYLPSKSTDIAQFMYFDNPFVHSSVMFRKSRVVELSGYDESLERAQDYDLWARMLSHGCRVLITRKKLVLVRRWSGSVTSLTTNEARIANTTHIRNKNGLRRPIIKCNYFESRKILKEILGKKTRIREVLDAALIFHIVCQILNEIQGLLRFLTFLTTKKFSLKQSDQGDI
jgi:glycosyltransferase involved in cell wall biosynthesis